MINAGNMIEVGAAHGHELAERGYERLGIHPPRWIG